MKKKPAWKRWGFVVGIAVFWSAFVATFSHAVDPTRQEPIHIVGTATRVSVSTSAWTLVPAASSLDRRGGMMLVLPAANTAGVRGVYSAVGTAPTIATTTYSVELAKGATYEIKNGSLLDLWLVSLHTAAESVGVQEIRYGK